MSAIATIPPVPDDALVDLGTAVLPALELEAWVRAEILAENRPLSNYDHAHLREFEARVAFLWCFESLRKKGRRVLGTAQLGEPSGDAWTKALRRDHLVRLFGYVPDFLITIDAHFAASALDERLPQNLLAVVEHELYHCGQDTNSWGDPRFTQDGEPVWGIRPHDTEEFAGVVRRYGVGASANAQPLVEAVDWVRAHGPDVAPSTLEGVCGSCLRKVA